MENEDLRLAKAIEEITFLKQRITELEKLKHKSQKDIDEIKDNSLWQGLFNNMPNGAAIYKVINDGSKGRDYIIKDFNEASLRIEGKTRDEVIGKSLLDLRPNIEEFGLIPIFQKVWQTGQSGYWPIHIYVDKKYDSWYENWVFKLPSGEIVAIYNDVTEQKKIEEQLRQSQKMDAIGQLAGGVAHDFNNMLSGIMGCTDVIAIKMGDNHELKEYLDLIIDLSLQASELTQKLLTFSRKEQIVKELFDVHESINKISAMLERSIDKRIEIHINLNADMSQINGDKSQIQNSILNLGINARDAMPDGGKLLFTTKNIDVSKAENVQDYKITPGKYIEIDIEDTGVGMNNEVKERIFEPFFTTKGLGKGTGLGLSVVYNTIKENNGSIYVYSEENKGTDVKIYLPLATDINAHKGDNVEQYIHGSGCILIVDDESVIRITVGEMLRELGYEVLFAEDGVECLELWKEKHASVDLVILDVVMPKMNGRDVFYALKEINPNVKVLMSSGYTQDTNTTKLIEDGALGFIQKPYLQIELSKKIAEALA